MSATAFEPDGYQLPHNYLNITRPHINNEFCWCKPYVYLPSLPGGMVTYIHRAPYAFMPIQHLFDIIVASYGGPQQAQAHELIYQLDITNTPNST